MQFLSLVFFKSQVYVNEPQTITELKGEIQNVIGENVPHFWQNVIENFMKRAKAYVQNGGGHMLYILFHT